MRTTKPISTISYNNISYLEQTLNGLIKSKIISFWAFIKHKPEDDECGNKPHIHVYVEPCKMLQTVDLKELFREFDPKHPDKPLGVIDFRCSKNFGDWYLYGLHDRAYLASKGQSRRYHYTPDEMYSSDKDELSYLVHTIDLLALSRYSDMLDAQKQGVTWSQYFARGTIPIQQIRNFELAWYTLLENHTNRNGKDGHSFDTVEVNTETGEIVDVFNKTQ